MLKDWMHRANAREGGAAFDVGGLGLGSRLLPNTYIHIKVQGLYQAPWLSAHIVNIADQKRHLYNTVARKFPSSHGKGQRH